MFRRLLKKDNPNFKDGKLKFIHKFSLICFIVMFSFLSLGAKENKKKESSAKQQDKQQTEKKNKETEQTEAETVAVLPGQPPTEDVEKIHDELKQIISRTQQLQSQVRDDRSEIRQILERAQIHQRILKGMTIPKMVQTKQQINQDYILAQEKMRLIAQQAHQTQEQLKTIQNSRFVNPVPKTES